MVESTGEWGLIGREGWCEEGPVCGPRGGGGKGCKTVGKEKGNHTQEGKGMGLLGGGRDWPWPGWRGVTIAVLQLPA